MITPGTPLSLKMNLKYMLHVKDNKSALSVQSFAYF